MKMSVILDMQFASWAVAIILVRLIFMRITEKE